MLLHTGWLAIRIGKYMKYEMGLVLRWFAVGESFWVKNMLPHSDGIWLVGKKWSTIVRAIWMVKKKTLDESNTECPAFISPAKIAPAPHPRL